MFKLNFQLIICLEVRTIDIEAGIESEFYDDEFEKDYENNIKFEFVGNKSLLPGPRSADHHVPKDTAGIIECNMIRSSPLAKSASAIINQGFLTSAVNWENRNI